MGWFRRNKKRDEVPPPREGVPINSQRYQEEVAEGTRPGLPSDGRYWMMLADVYDDEVRLVWEKAASYREAKSQLKNFATYCQMKPERLNRGHMDDVDGMWAAHQPRRTLGILSIWHPKHIGAARQYREMRDRLGLDSH